MTNNLDVCSIIPEAWNIHALYTSTRGGILYAKRKVCKASKLLDVSKRKRRSQNNNIKK